MADIEVRLARTDEHHAIGGLAESAYAHDDPISDTYRADIRDVASRAADGAGSQVWVAVDTATGELLATVTTPRPARALSELARPGELEFRLLAVAPIARRRGVGRLLVEHVIDLARIRYASAVVMNSGPAMTGAHRLYEQLGFVRKPDRETRVVHEGNGVEASTRLMAFALELTTSTDGTPTRMLDNPALAALNSHHAHLAERRGEVARYQLDVSPWTGLPDSLTNDDWTDLAELIGPDGQVGLPPSAVPPPGWRTVDDGGEGVQMIAESIRPQPDSEAIELGVDDVPEILELVGRTKPGPYLPRTIEMGRYLGIRRDGRLIALAGERLHPPGFTEISAVCTDPEFRGQGLATRLVLAVAAGIVERGETPFLHAFAGNSSAIRLYAELGFRLRLHSSTRTVAPPAP